MKKFLYIFLIICTMMSCIFVPAMAAESTEDIPEGYRLATESDVGKTFGIELEPYVIIDKSVTPLMNAPEDQETDLFVALRSLQFSNSFNYGIIVYSVEWIYEFLEIYSIDTWYGGVKLVEQLPYSGEITLFNTDFEWNNWLYVKDKTDTPVPEEPIPEGPELKGNLWNYTYDFLKEILGTSESPTMLLFLELLTLLICLFIIGVPFLAVIFMVKTIFRSVWK